MSVRQKPLVSIVIPAYNYGALIGETLASIQTQSYQNWECFIVDDGSTDNTQEIVASYSSIDKRIRYIFQKNQGPSIARNNALAKCHGTYIQFLDADDLLQPRKIEAQVEYLEQHPEVGLVYGDWKHFDTDDPTKCLYSMGTLESPDKPRISGKGKAILRNWLYDNHIVISAPLLRMKMIKEVGNFDETILPLEDWDYWLRCAFLGDTIQYLDLPETASLVRIHPGSLSRNLYRWALARYLVRRKAGETIKDPELRGLNQQLMVTDEGLLGVEEIKLGNVIKGLRHIIKCGSLSQSTRERWKWFYLAMMIPFVSRDRIDEIVFTPIGKFIRQILLLQKLPR